MTRLVATSRRPFLNPGRCLIKVRYSNLPPRPPAHTSREVAFLGDEAWAALVGAAGRWPTYGTYVVHETIASGCTDKRRSTPAVRMPFSVKAGRGGQCSFRRRPDHAP